jgi:hypothetical protein
MESVEIYIRHIQEILGCYYIYMVYGKLKVAKSKSSRLSYNWVVSLPPASISIEIFKCETKIDDSVMSFISNLPDTCIWNRHIHVRGTVHC